MPSLNYLLPFFVAASSLTSVSLAKPAPAPQAPAAANAEVSASNAAASAYAQYTANQGYSAAAASAASYYATASGSGTGPAPAQITGPDACGPKTPDPLVADSCDSYVEKVDTPHPYGVQCLQDGSGGNLNVTSCQELIGVMCSNEFQHAGEWVWASNNGCSLGSYLPSAAGSASWPPQANCEVLIYGAMLEACATNNQFNVAAVNLPALPNNSPDGSGQQVNVGYPSYVISEYQLRNVSDATCTSGDPPTQVKCATVSQSPGSNNIDAAGILAQQELQYQAALLSESQLLATMTGTAAAAARSDFAAFVADDGADTIADKRR